MPGYHEIWHVRETGLIKGNDRLPFPPGGHYQLIFISSISRMGWLNKVSKSFFKR
jgi:hypothetical protein